MARGNRGEVIFLDDDDRRSFLRRLEEVCKMTGWRVHAWVLMSNHYDFFIETPEANLMEGMKWFQNSYTRRFNVRHKAQLGSGVTTIGVRRHNWGQASYFKSFSRYVFN